LRMSDVHAEYRQAHPRWLRDLVHAEPLETSLGVNNAEESALVRRPPIRPRLDRLPTLVEGTSHAWCRCPAEQGDEVDDWLCRDCYAKRLGSLTSADLLYICIHCVRRLRRRSKLKKRRRK